MKKYLFAGVLLFLLSSFSFSQETWTTYTRTTVIYDIAVQGKYIWCGTEGGLVRWDTTDSTYTTFTSADGLYSNGIGSICVASDGKVWCSMGGSGVGCYDGHNWKTYTTEDGLPFNIIWAIAEAPNGDIWVSSAESTLPGYIGGLAIFNGETWDYLPITGMDESPIISIVFGPDGTLWCSDSQKILHLYNNQWEKFNEEYEITNKSIRDLTIGPNGNPCFGTSSGIYYYNNGIWEFTEDEFHGEVYSIAVEEDNTVWRGTYNMGVVSYQNSISTHYTTADGLPNDIVGSLAVGEDGRVWCGTKEGLAVFNNGKWVPFKTSKKMSDPMVWSIAKTPDGTIWCGGRYGISGFDGSSWKYYNFTDGMLSGTVTSMVADRNGVLWCVILDVGISCFDGYTWTNYTASDDSEFANISCMAVDPKGDMWFGTIYYGVLRYDGSRWVKYTTENGLPGNKILSVAIGTDGSTWFSISGHGVSRFDGTTWKNYTTRNGLLDNTVSLMAVAPNGNIWIGYYGINSISKFDGTNWVSYSPEIDILRYHTRSIAVDNKGAVWCASFYYGAIKFDGESWKVYTIKDGLACNEVCKIVIGENGEIFFGTSNGLSIMNSHTSAVDTFDARPNQYLLEPNYPNPFNPSTSICFSLPADLRVTLKIYNIAGQEVKTLKNEIMSAGNHSVLWNAENMPSGIYLYTLKAGSYKETKKMTLLK